jgi:hypothetical protein
MTTFHYHYDDQALIAQSIGMLAPQLKRFKRVSKNQWQFRCPYCGDSKRNPIKARGYIFPYKGRLFFKCHNCQISRKSGESQKRHIQGHQITR